MHSRRTLALSVVVATCLGAATSGERQAAPRVTAQHSSACGILCLMKTTDRMAKSCIGGDNIPRASLRIRLQAE